MHIHDADLGPLGRANTAAQCLGQELVAQAKAKERQPPALDCFTNQSLFIRQPRMFIFLPDIHRPAHDPEPVITVERRKRFALIQLDGIIGVPVLFQELAKDAGMFDGGVLQD